MTLEDWNICFKLASGVALLFTFVAGIGALWTGHFVAKRQERALAEARKTADTATGVAVNERSQREFIESMSLPRRLNSLNEAEYRNRLEPFAGTKFHVVTLQDAEPTRFGRMIERLLADSRWDKEQMIWVPETGETQIEDGIWIESNGPIHGTPTIPPSPMKPAMEAVKAVLDDSRIETFGISFLNPRLPPAQLPPNTIRIVIGLKPDPYLTMRRLQLEAQDERLRRTQERPPK